MTPIEKEFEAAMLDTYEQAKRFKYDLTYFKRMVQERGGVGAAKRLLAAQNAQSGLFTLWESGGLGFSMEVLKLQGHFHTVFIEEVLTKTHNRLGELDYFRK